MFPKMARWYVMLVCLNILGINPHNCESTSSAKISGSPLNIEYPMPYDLRYTCGKRMFFARENDLQMLFSVVYRRVIQMPGSNHKVGFWKVEERWDGIVVAFISSFHGKQKWQYLAKFTDQDFLFRWEQIWLEFLFGINDIRLEY